MYSETGPLWRRNGGMQYGRIQVGDCRRRTDDRLDVQNAGLVPRGGVVERRDPKDARHLTSACPPRHRASHRAAPRAARRCPYCDQARSGRRRHRECWPRASAPPPRRPRWMPVRSCERTPAMTPACPVPPATVAAESVSEAPRVPAPPAAGAGGGDAPGASPAPASPPPPPSPPPAMRLRTPLDTRIRGRNVLRLDW